MALAVLRIENAMIHKKYELIGKAEVKFYSFVADDRFSMPELDVLMTDQNPEEVRKHIREISKAVLNSWESVTVQKVKKNHVFNFGDTGKIVYQSQTVPQLIEWIMLAVEVDKDIRQLGDHIDEILPEDKADELTNNILALGGFAGGPPAMAAAAISKYLIRSVTHFMKRNENDQVGLIHQSFVRSIDYPEGSRRGELVQDLTANMWYTYTLFSDEHV